MKKLISYFLAAVTVVLFFPGCATTGKQKLDPAGVYAGDTAHFDTDVQIVQASRDLKAALDWADLNPGFVAKNDNLAQAITTIREHKDDWIAAAYKAWDVYDTARTPENATGLRTALGVIQGALNAYYAAKTITK